MLVEYVQKNCDKGTCQCERCIDAPKNSENHQPSGHTADLIFFKIVKTDSAKKQEYEDIIKNEFPHWLDGKEHNYLEIGGDVGDQGIGLMAMGLGKLLGIWELLTPNTMMPFLPDKLKMQMAGQGMISIKKN